MDIVSPPAVKHRPVIDIVAQFVGCPDFSQVINDTEAANFVNDEISVSFTQQNTDRDGNPWTAKFELMKNNMTSLVIQRRVIVEPVGAPKASA